MITIQKELCPKWRYDLKCPYTRTPSRIVVHNTANDAPALSEITYMVNNDNEVSYHYAVDEKWAVQGLPLERNAWASGDGHGEGNMEGIHIEICWSKSGGERFEKAERNAAELIAQLLKQYGWGIDKVTKHQAVFEHDTTGNGGRSSDLRAVEGISGEVRKGAGGKTNQ